MYAAAAAATVLTESRVRTLRERDIRIPRSWMGGGADGRVRNCTQNLRCLTPPDGRELPELSVQNPRLPCQGFPYTRSPDGICAGEKRRPLGRQRGPATVT